jgi:hypothetical protein
MALEFLVIGAALVVLIVSTGNFESIFFKMKFNPLSNRPMKRSALYVERHLFER